MQYALLIFAIGVGIGLPYVVRRLAPALGWLPNMLVACGLAVLAYVIWMRLGGMMGFDMDAALPNRERYGGDEFLRFAFGFGLPAYIAICGSVGQMFWQRQRDQ